MKRHFGRMDFAGRSELTPRAHINLLLFALHFVLLAPKGYTVFGDKYIYMCVCVYRI